MSFEKPMTEMTEEEILAEVRALRERRSRAVQSTVTKASARNQAARAKAPSMKNELTPEVLAILAMTEAAAAQTPEPPSDAQDLNPSAGT